MTEGIRFGEWDYLWVLALIPIAYIILWAARSARRRAAEAFSGSRLVPRLLRSHSHSRERLKSHLLALSLLFLVLALIRPKWGYDSNEVIIRGPDVMVALDVSRSMLSQDVTPDRLTRAVLELQNFALDPPAGRLGLVVFAGTAFTQCPLTSDHAAFRMFLGGASIQSVPHGGTAIGEAIRRCISSFNAARSAQRMILLVSDGEDLGGDAIAAARKAEEEGITIYTIGVGTPDGVPIPITDANGNVSFVKEPGGTVHLSRLNEDVLRQIAGETGGAYSHISSPSWGIEQQLSVHVPDDQRPTGKKVVRYYHERFQLPLLLAFVFLLLEAILPRAAAKRLVEAG